MFCPIYVLQEGGLIKETWMDEDPREAILKYADAAEKDPKFIAPAYSQTQPKPVFAESDSDNEEK
jgi:WD repeat-containing protein 70